MRRDRTVSCNISKCYIKLNFYKVYGNTLSHVLVFEIIAESDVWYNALISFVVMSIDKSWIGKPQESPEYENGLLIF